jgi:hypothetical protein
MKVGDVFLRSSYFTSGRVERKNVIYKLSLAVTPFAKGIQTMARGLETASYKIPYGIRFYDILFNNSLTSNIASNQWMIMTDNES